MSTVYPESHSIDVKGKENERSCCSKLFPGNAQRTYSWVLSLYSSADRCDYAAFKRRHFSIRAFLLVIILCTIAWVGRAVLIYPRILRSQSASSRAEFVGSLVTLLAGLLPGWLLVFGHMVERLQIRSYFLRQLSCCMSSLEFLFVVAPAVGVSIMLVATSASSQDEQYISSAFNSHQGWFLPAHDLSTIATVVPLVTQTFSKSPNFWWFCLSWAVTFGAIVVYVAIQGSESSVLSLVISIMLLMVTYRTEKREMDLFVKSQDLVETEKISRDQFLQAERNNFETTALRQILSNVSHDLQSPIQGLEMGFETLLQTLQDRALHLLGKEAPPNGRPRRYSEDHAPTPASGTSPPRTGLQSRNSLQQSDGSVPQQLPQLVNRRNVTLPPLHTESFQTAISTVDNSSNDLVMTALMHSPLDNPDHVVPTNSFGASTVSPDFIASPVTPHRTNGPPFEIMSPGTVITERNESTVIGAEDVQTVVAMKVCIDLVNTMIGTLTFMSMIINRSLDAAKLQGGMPLIPNYEFFDFTESVTKTARWISDMQSRIRIVIAPIPPMLHNMVYTDKRWFEGNILCMLSNAVKYSEEPHEDKRANDVVELRAFVYENSTLMPGKVIPSLTVEIVDCGPPVNESDRSKFFAAPEQRVRNELGGSGLGLYTLCKRVEALGGTTGSYARTDRSGSVFWFSIPFTRLRRSLQNGKVGPGDAATAGGSFAAVGGGTVVGAITTITETVAKAASRSSGPISRINSKQSSAKDGSSRSKPSSLKSRMSSKLSSLISSKGSVNGSEKRVQDSSSDKKNPQLDSIPKKQKTVLPAITSPGIANISVIEPLRRTGGALRSSFNSVYDDIISRGGSRANSVAGNSQKGDNEEDDDDHLGDLKNRASRRDEELRDLKLFSIDRQQSEDVTLTVTQLQQMQERRRRSAAPHPHNEDIEIFMGIAERLENLEGEEMRTKTSHGVSISRTVSGNIVLSSPHSPINGKSVDAGNSSSNANLSTPVANGNSSGVQSAGGQSFAAQGALQGVEADSTVHYNAGEPPQATALFTPPSSSREANISPSACFSGRSVCHSARKDPSLSVLVVDDSISIMKIMKMSLERAGHSVRQATNGQQAVDIMRTKQFDVVMMDLQMPVMGGIEAVTRWREMEEEMLQKGDRFTKQLIIGMSANCEANMRHEAIMAGMDEFIAKPFTLSSMMAVLREREEILVV